MITEVVINHTSDQHPWFQRARRAAPGSKWRDFYVWSDSPRNTVKPGSSSRISRHPTGHGIRWPRRTSGTGSIRISQISISTVRMSGRLCSMSSISGSIWAWTRFVWTRFRTCIERSGTNCENLPETHAFLKQIRAHVDAKYKNRMLLAEANQWPDDSIAYFGEGNECHMAFHFPVMPRMFMANRMEDRYPIIEIMRQTPAIPENCQWAMFLRNHDELTLEMVTDEERDYMYRVYAQDRQMRINLGIRRRLAPLLGNDRRRSN